MDSCPYVVSGIVSETSKSLACILLQYPAGVTAAQQQQQQQQAVEAVGDVPELPNGDVARPPRSSLSYSGGYPTPRTGDLFRSAAQSLNLFGNCWRL